MRNPLSVCATVDSSAAGGSRRRTLAALCVTVIVSYGVIYYAFPVMAAQIAASTGWSRTAVTTAYSAGNLAGALAGEVAKRVDIAAAAIFHGMTVDEISDLDLSYTPPLGSPWDAVQMATQAWTRNTRRT